MDVLAGGYLGIRRGENNKDATDNLIMENRSIVIAENGGTKLDNIVRLELARLGLGGFKR